MKTESTKPQSPKHDKLLQVRITENQYNGLLKRATNQNLNVSDYVRKVAIGNIK